MNPTAPRVWPTYSACDGLIVAGVIGAMAVANSAINPFIFLYFKSDADTCCRPHSASSRNRFEAIDRRHPQHGNFHLDVNPVQQPNNDVTARTGRRRLTCPNEIHDDVICARRESPMSVAVVHASAAAAAGGSSFDSQVPRGRSTSEQERITTSAVCLTVTYGNRAAKSSVERSTDN